MPAWSAGQPIGSVVELTAADLAIVESHAVAQDAQFEPNPHYQRDARPGLELKRFGLAGEYAFCKLYDLPFKGDDDWFDAVLPDGRTVDVKSARPGRNLVVDPYRPGKRADLFALMIGAGARFKYVGVATRERIVDPSTLRQLRPADPRLTHVIDVEAIIEIPLYSGIRTDGRDPLGDAMRDAIRARWLPRLTECARCRRPVVPMRARRDGDGPFIEPTLYVDAGTGQYQAQPWHKTFLSTRFRVHTC